MPGDHKSDHKSRIFSALALYPLVIDRDGLPDLATFRRHLVGRVFVSFWQMIVAAKAFEAGLGGAVTLLAAAEKYREHLEENEYLQAVTYIVSMALDMLDRLNEFEIYMELHRQVDAFPGFRRQYLKPYRREIIEQKLTKMRAGKLSRGRVQRDSVDPKALLARIQYTQTWAAYFYREDEKAKLARSKARASRKSSIESAEWCRLRK